MPVKALWFDGRPNMLVSSDQNTLMQREKGRVAGDVSIGRGVQLPSPAFQHTSIDSG